MKISVEKTRQETRQDFQQQVLTSIDQWKTKVG